jgi:predicted Zn finger-like uncharacterized protein
MLVTECTHCGARFRATPEQLNQRQGQVRCGECQGIFNAFESIVRVPAETGQALPQAASVPGVPAAAPADPDILDFLDAPAAAEPVADPEQRPTTLEEILHPRSPADARSDEGPPELPEGSGGELAQVEREVPDPAATLAPARPARPARAWSLGVLLLALVLAMQAAYAFRAQLARNYPTLRPALESACATVGCRVPWVNDESALRLEDSEMLEVPGKPGQIALQARIRNLSSSAQEFPYLELTLTDLTGQAAIRRVLRPADYLGRGAEGGRVMAAGSEALLSVRLETGRIHATGYELLLFYP